MSTDHIFAGQMWNWPEPMIKRDSHGRILVVNAAFLQLYGGTVESWTGNPISGWPDPHTPGHVSRFESRIPLPTGGETVYDWVECALEDGSSLAMARDVSVFVQAAAPVNQAPLSDQAPLVHTPAEMQAEPAPVQNQTVPVQVVATEPSQAAVQNDLSQLVNEVVTEPTMHQEPVTAEPIVQRDVMVKAEIPAAASAPFEPQPGEKSPVVAPLPIENVALATDDIAAAPTPPAPPPPASETNDARDFERRALPIENDDAILGNNWRDAVIAKAAGLDDLPSENAVQEENTPQANAAEGSTKGIRVLLAEDNAINALLTRTLLEAEGCHCDVVEDGALAVEAVKNNQYDMIFMDMRMPNMDGLEATRKIRAMGHGANVLPIVALTANAFDDDRNACFDSGMNDFMTKPVSAEELSDMVKSHTGLEAQKIAS